MIKHIAISALGLFMLTACQSDKEQEIPVNFGTEAFDSTALHIALIPHRESLPIYYAEQKGIFKRIGLNLQIASYKSQLECDTALLGNFADGGLIDRARLDSYHKQADRLSILWQKPYPIQIFTCHTLRIKHIKNLYGRTIGTTRSSAEDNVLNFLLDKYQIAPGDVYRPQINDMKLRAEMLDGNQIDAALLSWPYTVLARSSQHVPIYTYAESLSRICLVQNTEKCQSERVKKQWELFEKGRKIAADSLKILGNTAYSTILQQEYGIPKEIADTIKF